MNEELRFVGEEWRHIAGKGVPDYMRSGPVGPEHAAQPMWPMVGYDAAHTGRCPHDTSRNTGHLKWQLEERSVLSPVVGADGMIYVVDSEHLQAIGPDGSEAWNAGSFPAWPGWCSAAIGLDGIVYFGSHHPCLDGLASVNPRTRKYVPIAVECGSDYFGLGLNGWSPTVGQDGTIYVMSGQNCLYAFSPDWTVRWQRDFGMNPKLGERLYELRERPILQGFRGDKKSVGWVRALGPDGEHDVAWSRGSPAIALDGTIVVGTWDDRLYALRPDGTVKWVLDVGTISSSPTVAEDGTVYVGTEEGLIALSPAGVPKWRYRTPGPILSTCSIATDGTIYFGSEDGCLRALYADGTKKWKYSGCGQIMSSPAVSAEGTIYFGSVDGCLRALDPDGREKWKFQTKGPVISSPAIAADGTIYVTSMDGYLYALGEGHRLEGLERDRAGHVTIRTRKVIRDARFETASRTDVGRSAKKRNEDAVGLHVPADEDVIKEYGILLVVADGVGGEPCGDEASKTAVRTLMEAYYVDTRFARPAAERLREAFTKANAAVFSASKEPDHHGMCTTLVAAAVFPDRAVFANVGDSRGYVIRSRGGIAQQVTIDHSEVQEMVQQGLLTREQADVASNRNIITRVVGTSHTPKVDIFDVRLSQGDAVMLCSDGLVTAVSDVVEIESIMLNSSLKAAVDRLVELAKGPRGHDNVTVCAARLTKVDTSE